MPGALTDSERYNPKVARPAPGPGTACAPEGGPCAAGGGSQGLGGQVCRGGQAEEPRQETTWPESGWWWPWPPGLPGPLRAVQRAMCSGQEQALPEPRPQTIPDEAHSHGGVPHLSMPPFHHPEHAIMTESASQALRVKQADSSQGPGAAPGLW